MSEKEKGESNSRNETEPAIEKPTTKKYPFQTTRQNNSTKITAESNENLVDKHNESKNDIDRLKDSSPPKILTQVVNEVPKPVLNIPQIVNEVHDQSSKDTTNIRESKPPSESATETLTENEIQLNLVEVAEQKESRKKIHRQDLTEKEINEICRDRDGKGKTFNKTRTPGLDPRFQQQNQTSRCFVMYTDFYRCENILGKGELACQWFKDVFTSICPLDWIRRWDEAREEGRLGWTKGRTQGKFPGNRYGD